MPLARLFLAVDLPDPVRATLAGLMTDAGGAPDSPAPAPLPGARWVPPGQLHLTLRFLGGVPEAAIPELQAALGRVRGRPFALALAGVGTFPQRAARPAGPAGPAPAVPSPRVLWAGVAPLDPLRALKRLVDGVLGPDREEGQRDFSPHVTLCRWKQDAGPSLGDPLARFLDQHAGLGGAPFEIRAFRLYRSQTLPDGPRYTALAEFPLSP